MGTNLVIITYPYHYHITQLAILRASQFLQPEKIYIIHDTIPNSQIGWNDLGRRLRDDLRKHGIASMSIPFEAIEETRTQPRGWIRQQYVKLNLHKILNEPDWIVLDGDAIMKTPLDPMQSCHINPGDKLPDAHRFFTNYTLDLKFSDITFNGNPVSFSAIPFRHIKRDTLQQLERYIQQLHGKTISELYDSFALANKSQYLEISEFELLSHFEHQILGNPLQLKPIKCEFVKTAEFSSSWNKQLDLLVLAGKDDISQDWYAQQGIAINHDIWDQLYSK